MLHIDGGSNICQENNYLSGNIAFSNFPLHLSYENPNLVLFFFFVKKFVLRKNSSQFFLLLSERFIYTMIKWKFPSKMIYKVVQEWRIDKVNFALSKRHKNKNVRHREYRSSIRFMLSLVFALHSCHAFIVAIMGHDGNLIGVFVKRKCQIAIAIHYNSFDNFALFLSFSLSLSKKKGIVFQCLTNYSRWINETTRITTWKLTMILETF